MIPTPTDAHLRGHGMMSQKKNVITRRYLNMRYFEHRRLRWVLSLITIISIQSSLM
jgi:hypothetical protein